MQRAEQLISLYQRFADNYKIFSQWNDALLVDSDAQEWQSILIKRSEIQRGLLAENEEILTQAKALMTDPITSKEEADRILVFYRRMTNIDIADYRLHEIIEGPLREYYEKTQDYLRLIGLNVTSSSLAIDLFYYADPAYSPIDALEYSIQAIAYGKQVSVKEHPDIWISTLSAYANMLGSIQTFASTKLDYFHYYDEAMAYFDNPEIGPLLLAQPNGQMFLSMLFCRPLYSSDSYFEMLPQNQERYRELMREQIQNIPTQYSQSEVALLKYCIRNIIGDLDADTAFQKLLAFYDRQDNPVFRLTGLHIESEDFMSNVYILTGLLNILANNPFEPEKRHTLTLELIQRVNQLVHAVPYAYMTSYVNYCCVALFEAMMPLLQNRSEILSASMSLLILRQPITYIHSLMVQEISLVIAKEMLRETPELFIPLYGSTVEEVRARSTELLDFISNAALLHDMGKFRIAGIINNQYRRISDVEFRYIKLHPSLGPKLFSNSELFAPYYDIMLGHHKTYDGKGGYPAEFDNTASPYRIIIDLITIADCTDAATDILGRNYARGKSFYDLLAELSDAKGTRYNPDIVSLLERTPKLCEKLDRLTGDERSRIYYKAYREVMNLNTTT